MLMSGPSQCVSYLSGQWTWPMVLDPTEGINIIKGALMCLLLPWLVDVMVWWVCAIDLTLADVHAFAKLFCESVFVRVLVHGNSSAEACFLPLSPPP